MKIDLRRGDCLAVLATLPDNSVDAVVTDPPYGLGKQPDPKVMLQAWLDGGAYTPGGAGFMGHAWDNFVPSPPVWAECLRVLKPGGHLVAFFGTRTYDLGTLAIRLAGFEIRDLVSFLYDADEKAETFFDSLSDDQLKLFDMAFNRESMGGWLFGSGFPKNKGSLKPGCEPITLARKPLDGTAAENVIKHGTGLLNVDDCRIGVESTLRHNTAEMGYHGGNKADSYRTGSTEGRWPANVTHDGSFNVTQLFPAKAGAKAPVTGNEPTANGFSGTVRYSGMKGRQAGDFYADTGSAARFFYCAKTSTSERHLGCENPGQQFCHNSTPRQHENSGKEKLGNHHPTVKPISLMEHLIQLVTPPGGLVLDPFMGSGSTGIACINLGFSFIGIEREVDFFDIAFFRITYARQTRKAA